MDATVEVGPSLIKKLGASDNKTRNQALQALIKTWLPSQSQISDDDFNKLWKGLFYCVWHSDKISNQSYLIDSLSSLLPVLQLPLSIQYFTVFISTMRREWTGIDRLRLDKFYLLIRRFMHFVFVLLKKNNWDLELVNVVMRVLKERAFLADDRVLGTGVNYHLVAVFLDEIRGFFPLRKEVCEVLFGGFVEVMAVVSDKILVGKIKSCLFDELFRAGRQLLEVKMEEKSGVCVELEEDVLNVGLVGLALGFASRFYELGSAENCVQGNRKVLLGLHEQFLKLEKDLAQSGIEISVPEVVNEEEVPTLVPIACNGSEEENGMDIGSAGGDGNVLLKKCKNSDGRGKKAKKNKNKKSSDGSKKKKEKKNDVENENADLSNGEEISGSSSDQNSVTFTDSVISNLQLQFEKVAAEVGLDRETATPITKKRKRTKETSKKQSKSKSESNGQVESENGVDATKSGEKSAKRVRFSMKSNLVWKPHSPLPPQSLRIPPSVTPRGSALKKGIPAGPVREMPGKKAKKLKQRAKSLKKKGMNGISPATKRLKKVKSVSL